MILQMHSGTRASRYSRIHACPRLDIHENMDAISPLRMCVHMDVHGIKIHNDGKVCKCSWISMPVHSLHRHPKQQHMVRTKVQNLHLKVHECRPSPSEDNTFLHNKNRNIAIFNQMITRAVLGCNFWLTLIPKSKSFKYNIIFNKGQGTQNNFSSNF